MKYLIVSRYGVMASVGDFVTRSCDYKHHELLILRTPRGTEIGEFLSVKQELISGMNEKSDGKVIGVASEEEISRMKRIVHVDQKEEMKFCREKIEKRELKMHLKYVEHILGGERIVFYFSAEGRVDFRDLVKDLAEKYKTRIEMKQIGARDEARLLAECGVCGMNLCCRLVLPRIEPVSMKMAKMQTTTLDPAKVSGRCGRLKCCFRYEHEVYQDLKKKLPNIGSIVKTRKLEGEVVGLDILTQKVTLSSKEEDIQEVELKDIIEIIKRQ